MNCQHGHHSTEVITKKLSYHEIFITKIYIHVIFNNFTKILNHENLELYGTSTWQFTQVTTSRALLSRVVEKHV